MVAQAIRFNREYFGYIAGFADGQIHLLNHSAGPALERGASFDELQQYLLDELVVEQGFHLATPLLVWFEITRKCNLTCPHCYIDAGHPRDGELATREILHLLEEMAQMGVWAVTFTGGEPTLHADFAKLVQFAHSQGLLVGVATNGMFLSDALLDQLPREGVIISVSCDNLHIMNPRDVTSDFKVAARAALRSQQMGFMANIMTNTHKRNIDQVEELLEWAQENGISVRSVPFTPYGRGRLHSELENTPEDVRKLAECWLKEKELENAFHGKVGLCVGKIFDYGETLGYLTRRCPSGRYLCYIASDGTVYPCTSCAGVNILSPGSVKGRSFSSVWRSEWEIRGYSWDNFKSTCEGCPINNSEYYCSSRCPAFSYARHRQYFACGASDFQIQSTIVRTAMLRGSKLAEYERPVRSNATANSIALDASIAEARRS
jgi:radical SAM protein with 4Fe4S-binding SPASM domain